TRFGWDAAKKQFVGSDQHHFDNFVKAVRSRKHEDLNADIREGHLSAALCHLANISYRLGNEGVIGKAWAVSDDKRVTERSARMVEHLKANKVNVDEAVGRFGLVLGIDPTTETFANKDLDRGLLAKANVMLFREYRKGFELKENA